MHIFSKIFGRFFKKNKKNTGPAHPGMVRTCIGMPQGIIHPCEMMEPLGIAIVQNTLCELAYSSTDISLFDMFYLDGSDFVGSFYALERNGMYYGNIVGHKEIVACEPNAFKFVKTDQLKVPFVLKDDKLYALLCCFNAKKGQIVPLLYGVFEKGVLVNTLHKFPQNTDLNEALGYCRTHQAVAMG